MSQSSSQRLEAEDKKDAMPLGPLSADEIASRMLRAFLRQLGVTRNGLRESEASSRLVRFGLNLLPRPKQTPRYLQLLANFVHFFALLLWVAAGWLGRAECLNWRWQ